MRRRSITLALALLALLSSSARGVSWQPDGIPVCTAPGPQGPLSGQQVFFSFATSTSGGLLVGWEDRRSTETLQSDLYVRVLGSEGGASTDGSPLCVASGDQTALALAYGQTSSCGYQAGCTVMVGAWQDTRDGGAADVFANRVGLPWGDAGVPVCRMPGSQQTPTVALATGPTGADESVIVWEDWRSGSGDIYAQRLDVDGQRMWDTSGVAVCTAAYEQVLPQAVSLGDGTVLVAWLDHRAFPSAARIRVMRLERDGSVTPGWPADGREVATSGLVQSYRLLSSGHLVWWELPPGGSRLRATRIQADGQFATAWSDSGVPVMPPVGAHVLIDACVGADGNLWVSRFDVTYSITMTPTYTLRVQRLGSDGAPWPGWGSTGVSVAQATPWMIGGRLAPSTTGAAYITWAAPDAADGALYLQRLTEAGGAESGWPAGGTVLCAAAGAPSDPVIGIEVEGVLVSWLDPRDDPADVYAQFVTHAGVVGPAAVEDVPVTALALGAPRPNPTRGGVALALALPRGGLTSAEVLDVSGRRVRALQRGAIPAGRHTLTWDGRDARGRLAPAGVYLVRVSTPDGEARARVVRLD